MLGALAAAWLAAASAGAPAADEAAVRAADAGFWTAFNGCDRAAMARRFTRDAEFYHDATGLTRSRRAVAASMADGPCADVAARRLRRVPIAGSDRFFPLAGGFALLEGRHRFLVSLRGGAERHDSTAGYIEVWQRDRGDGGWRMRRVVSFDHRPDVPALVAVPLAPADARRRAGRYAGADGTAIVVEAGAGGLVLRSGDARFPLVHLGGGRFGTPGRWLEIAFPGDSVTIREEGIEVARATRVPASPPAPS